MKIECPIVTCKAKKEDIIIEEDSHFYICRCKKCNAQFIIPKETK